MTGTAQQEENSQENQSVEAAAVASEPSLQDQLNEWKDRALRAMAEMENMRKRAQKDVEDAKNFSMANFAKDMLLIGDNLSRALQTIGANEKNAADGLFKSLIEGVEMTQHELARLFERHGIVQVPAKGEKFNPNIHQAMFEIATAEHAPGTCVEEIQSGFTLKERVLRPAFVGVAKAPEA